MLHIPQALRSPYWLKAALAVLLVAIADWLFIWHEPGTTLGLFALAWIGAVAIGRRGLLRDRRSLGAMAAATLFALVIVDRPSPLAWLLFLLSLSVAVLSARVKQGEPAWNWLQRLVVLGVVSWWRPIMDAGRLWRLRRNQAGLTPTALLGRLLMPVAGGALFLALFSAANPLISGFFESIRVPALTPETIVRVMFWTVVLVAVGGTLRPYWARKLIDLPAPKQRAPSAALTSSVTWSLIVFNAVFALQNGLDAVFLWSGAPLPGDVTLADYAHRGAYPLIATALLAGLFVLMVLSPGSDMAKRPWVRRLVVVWVAQNMLLVASSILRTVDYIETYALTPMRIAAILWMVLVGVGLVLICWRMMRDRSAHWLIDANAFAALGVLAVVSAVDLGAVAAAWNVRHAKEVGGRGVELDLAYLGSLGSPALVSLVELETSTRDPRFRNRIAIVRHGLMTELQRRQRLFDGWTWRDQRRLDRIEALTRGRLLAPPAPDIVTPAAPPPLTSPTGR
jgi:hypothetical protein